MGWNCHGPLWLLNSVAASSENVKKAVPVQARRGMMGRAMQGILTYLRSFRQPAVASDTDGELLARFRRQRDQSAFTTLVQRHGPMVLGIARRILGRADLAEDVFQAVFLVLAQKAKKLERWPTVAGWLVQVARRTALHARGKSARLLRHGHEAAAMTATSITPDPGLGTERQELVKQLDEELARLPAKYRTPLVLCHLQGRSKEQAAQELGWPVGSVSGRLARAKVLLKARLLRRGIAPAVTAGVLSAPRIEAAVSPLLVQATTLLVASVVHKTAPAPVSATVALAQGVAMSMLMTKIKWAAAAVVVLALGIGSGAMALQGKGKEAGPGENAAPQEGKVEGKAATLEEQIRGVWVVEEIKGPEGPPKFNDLVVGYKYWLFENGKLNVAPEVSFRTGTTSFERKLAWGEFRLIETTKPAQISFGRWHGILKIADGKLVINLAHTTEHERPPATFDPGPKLWTLTLRRANDYDRLEGIWRRETRNPVTLELEFVEELIFRRNLFVRRYYSIPFTAPVNDATHRRLRPERPELFELHERLSPKGIDWGVVDPRQVEQNIRHVLDDPNALTREANLKQYWLRERQLGIYEFSKNFNELRMYLHGIVGLEVDGNRLRVQNEAERDKRPTAFPASGENVQVYQRVDRSFKDSMPPAAAGTTVQPPTEQNSNKEAAPVLTPKLRELREQRLKIAREKMEVWRAAYNSGAASIEEMQAIATQILEAKLALAKNRAEEVQALEEALAHFKQFEESMETKRKSGSATQTKVLDARLRRIELEIQIEELKNKP
jgi:RNA polymerase sigma factor (sigma-70 family)